MAPVVGFRVYDTIFLYWVFSSRLWLRLSPSLWNHLGRTPNGNLFSPSTLPRGKINKTYLYGKKKLSMKAKWKKVRTDKRLKRKLEVGCTRKVLFLQSPDEDNWAYPANTLKKIYFLKNINDKGSAIQRIWQFKEKIKFSMVVLLLRDKDIFPWSWCFAIAFPMTCRKTCHSSTMHIQSKYKLYLCHQDTVKPLPPAPSPLPFFLSPFLKLCSGLCFSSQVIAKVSQVNCMNINFKVLGKTASLMPFSSATYFKLKCLKFFHVMTLTFKIKQSWC